ncbi:aldolase/citrate lyase family protein [Prauserella flavalba]|uniref:HpcH/HpaI aldolase/citrate lyase domain-containing protein n=1 Tax=Prauserella flavalba TaxID=1477506 RepID=A0A318LHU0_9PSEU|nr:aldolase/citrate lyase family protein [Prauserella flavalba]PXY21520.1 hypothetical protein BA062_31930 [Prauserella flavalba]
MTRRCTPAATGYRASGEEIAVIPQLESRDAIDAVREIGAVDGVAALFVGPADLAVTTGLTTGSAAFAALLDDVASAAKALELPLGTAVGTAAAARELADHHDFVLIANDASLLGQAARALVTDAHRDTTQTGNARRPARGGERLRSGPGSPRWRRSAAPGPTAVALTPSPDRRQVPGGQEEPEDREVNSRCDEWSDLKVRTESEREVERYRRRTGR